MPLTGHYKSRKMTTTICHSEPSEGEATEESTLAIVPGGSDSNSEYYQGQLGGPCRLIKTGVDSSPEPALSKANGAQSDN